MIILLAGFLVNGNAAHGEQQLSDVAVGSFGVGGKMVGTIDDRMGLFQTALPVVSLPGIIDRFDGDKTESPSVNRGSVEMSVVYRQNAAQSNNRYGLGSVWGWNINYVDVDGGVRVFPTSGGMFEADESQPSGMAGYVLGDCIFRQQAGVLPARDTVGEVSYAFVLSHMGGMTEYFNGAGDLIARVGMFGERSDWLWEADHRLVGIVDASGSHVKVMWTQSGVEIVSPTRSDGRKVTTFLELMSERVTSLVNAEQERIDFTYDASGLLERIVTDKGAQTTLSYQQLLDNNTAIERIRVTDSSGAELSSRYWAPVGDHIFSGWPFYDNQETLGASGDGDYRYVTETSDGFTRILSEYNSLGLRVSRDMVVSTSTGDRVVQEQNFVFPGTETGGVHNPQLLTEQYSNPTQMRAVFRDSVGRTRTVTEQAEYNKHGQNIRRISADGTITESIFDTEVHDNLSLPIGLLIEQTTTGVDGMVSKTVNTLTDDHRAVRATETFVGSVGALESASHVENVVESDGFVSENRVAAPRIPQELTPLTAVVTRFDRIVNGRTVTVTQTDAAGTNAQSTVSTVMDRVTGLPLSQVDPTGRVASTVYDAVGRVIEEKDFAGRTTTTQYEKNVTRTTDPLGITRSEYVNALGQIMKRTDNIVAGLVGRVVQETGTRFERTIETRKYEHNSSRVTSIDERGLETVTVSDVFGRVVSVTAPNGVTQLTEYDDVAHTVSTGLVPSGSSLANALRVSTVRKDTHERDVSVMTSRDDGVAVSEETTTYDGVGRVTSRVSGDVLTRTVRNPNGTAKTTTLTPTSVNNKGRVFSSHEALSQDEQESFFKDEQESTVRVDREHNGMGVVTKKTLSQAGKSQAGVGRVLDAAGRTVSETNQAGVSTTYEYTVDGLVSVIRYGGTGVVTRNTYDPVTRNRVEMETVAPNGDISRTGFEYDPVTGKTLAVFDPSDRENTQIHYMYDVFGNTTCITYPDGKTVTHAFDEHGQEMSTTDVVGNVTVFEYNRFGVITEVKQRSSHHELIADVRYEYDLWGRGIKIVRGNEVTTQRTYTSADLVATEKTTHNGKVVIESSYEYDSHNNLTQRVDVRPCSSVDASEAGAYELASETTVYEYDGFNRLIGSAVFDGPAQGVRQEGEGGGTLNGSPRLRNTYALTVAGDVARHTTVEAGKSDNDTTREFEYNCLGQLVGVTTNGVKESQTFDAGGNLIHAIDGTQYTYDVLNRVISETRPGGEWVEHAYWPTGQRKMISTHSAEAKAAQTGAVAGEVETVKTYWDGDILINDAHTLRDDANTTGASSGSAERGMTSMPPEDDSSRTETASYMMGTERDSRSFLSVDGALVDDTEYYVSDRHNNTVALTTNTGSISAVYTYSDYGILTSLFTTPSQPVNPFLYAGEYTASTGKQYLGNRLYDPDVMRFTTHDTAELHNLYAYASANPITKIDPTGHFSEEDSRRFLEAGMGLLMAAIGFGFSLAAFGPVFVMNSFGTFAEIFGLMTTALDGIFTVIQFTDSAKDEENTVQAFATVSLILGVVTLVGGFGSWFVKKVVPKIDWHEPVHPFSPPPSRSKNDLLFHRVASRSNTPTPSTVTSPVQSPYPGPHWQRSGNVTASSFHPKLRKDVTVAPSSSSSDEASSVFDAMFDSPASSPTHKRRSGSFEGSDYDQWSGPEESLFEYLWTKGIPSASDMFYMF